MAITYRTADGDMLDQICWSYYGTSTGVTEAALGANPGLGDLGPRYAAGVEIVLPDLPPSTVPAVNPVRLWD
jgi:phage tail protein X